MPTPQPETHPGYVQASFRLTPETFETIKAIASDSNTTQSQVMRKAVQLLKHTASLKPTQKLAVVDIDDSKGTSHYKVCQWIVE